MSASIKTYTNASKLEIQTRIGEINKKAHFVELFKIIHDHNEAYTYTPGKGAWINLAQYDDNLLSKIETFINKKYPRTIIKPISEGMSSYCSDDSDYKSLKLTNQERNILKRNDENDKTNSASESTHSKRKPIIKQLS